MNEPLETESLTLSDVSEWTDEQEREPAARCLSAARPFGNENAAPDFEAAMEYVFQKNADLYRRLA